MNTRTKLSMFLRSFSIQATWNYRTLCGAGFAYVVLPALQRIYGQDTERMRAALARHTSVFNSHPYLAGIALGAVAKLESEGADPAVIDRFKTALRGSLGTLGDQLVWAGWRPVCALLGLSAMMMSAPWWLVVGLFLVVYNAGHIFVRIWGFRVGWRYGTGVAERLRRPWLAEVQRAITTAGAFLLGVALPLTVFAGVIDLPHVSFWALLAVAGAVAGLVWGGRVRTPVVLVLALFAMIGILVRWF